MILHANCKVNLGLNITRRRDDGFHELCTVMLPVHHLYDIVEVHLSSSHCGVTFSSRGLEVDCAAEDNLCVRAAELMLQRYAEPTAPLGVDITLDKRVPFGAGLGGGSSDATAVLKALNELMGLDLAEQEMINLAAELGSDTPFFVRNTPQYCTGRGEIMEPMPDCFCDLIDSLRIEIITPENVHISTREAFSGIVPRTPDAPLLELLLERPLDMWQGAVVNDFERHIFARHPELQKAKEHLLQRGALFASMSGSGSALFGLFRS